MPRSSDSHPHVKAANQYARDIVKGKIPSCRNIRLECQRHLNELKESKKRAFKYKFDPDIAERWCKWVEMFPHVKGRWARTKQLLVLEPWQCFAVARGFGWVKKKKSVDGRSLRRFRKFFWLIPRKNAKSTLASTLALGGLLLDGEPGAEVYCGATSEKQSWEIFGPAKTMAERSPALIEATGLTVGAKNLHRLADQSKMEPIIGNPGDGSSPHFALVDEYHEHQSDRLVDTMLTGMGARDQPLLLVVTTAGDNIAGPCYEMQLDAQRMLDGVVEDEELFPLIYGIDAEDDWTSEEALRKANPNFDVSVSGEFLLSQQREAVRNPRKAGVFKTKHLNVWVQARNAYFDIDRWKKAECENIKLEDFYGQPIRLAVDLASTIDVAAVEGVIELRDCDCETAMRLQENGFEYVRFGKYYLPEDTVNNTTSEHYEGWVNQGYITQTDGEMIDFNVIQDDILWFAEMFDLLELAFDPFQATQMISDLEAEGLECVVVRHTVQSLSGPMKLMDGEIRARKIAHDGDPVFTWMLSNVVAKEDAKDNVYPRRLRREDKIDGAVAHMMAKARIGMDDGPKPSVYEKRGLLRV